MIWFYLWCSPTRYSDVLLTSFFCSSNFPKAGFTLQRYLWILTKDRCSVTSEQVTLIVVFW
jgi:hypothetical protein